LATARTHSTGRQHWNLSIEPPISARDPNQNEQFACLACRSIDQAEAKAREYRNSGPYRYAVLVMSVWEHYGIVCDQIGCARIPKHPFPDHSVNGVLHHIKMSQPDVFDALEERRRALWVGQNGKNLFDSGMTVVFTSHALAKHWYWNHVTRTWHHPDFVPFAQQDHAAMRADLMISEIVIDEPERDIILNLIPESLCDWLKRMKRRHPGWNSKSCKERYKIYESEKAANEIPGKREFDEIDELMHLNLDDLCLQEVNYEAIPFGFDQKGTGIYSVKTGEGLNLGVQDWLLACKARLTFLTTEAVISDVVTQAYEKLREAKQRTRAPIVLDLNACFRLMCRS
jgi:hypothetical protein